MTAIRNYFAGSTLIGHVRVAYTVGLVVGGMVLGGWL